METYLVQRGIVKNRDYKIGIDSIVEFEYMGASEYEWGALPDSLKRIRKNISEYTYLDVPIKDKVISVFCKSEQKAEIKQFLEKLASGKMRVKCCSYFDQYVSPSEYERQWQKKHPLETNFWWDLDNDIMFWVKNPDFELQFKSIIEITPKDWN